LRLQEASSSYCIDPGRTLFHTAFRAGLRTLSMAT
jgi:hypothetical protein